MEETAESRAMQYLTFTLDQETFALQIDNVREVLEFTSVTKVPQTPDYMRGVINLRGNVLPVIDLRLKFGMGPTQKSLNTCIIIAELLIAGETVVIGSMADSVQEVVNLEPEQIQPPPRLGNRLDTDFIKGMGKLNGNFIMILDIGRCFRDEGLLSAGSEQWQVANG